MPYLGYGLAGIRSEYRRLYPDTGDLVEAPFRKQYHISATYLSLSRGPVVGQWSSILRVIFPVIGLPLVWWVNI